jgi:hypothetical protein
MSRPRKIEVGSLVILEHAEEHGDIRTTVIVEAVQDDALVVAQVDGVPLPKISEGSTVRLILVERNTVYGIGAIATRVGQSSMRVELGPNAEPVAQRQYVRIAVDVPVTALILNAATNQWAPFEGSVTDLSAGGMALSAEAIAPAGATIVISIAMPNEEPVVAIGRTLHTDDEIRRVVQLATRNPIVRLEYTSIREADRERLIRFIFSEMLKQRRIELEHDRAGA